MKHILLKKTRKANNVKRAFNECFADLLRVLVVEFIEFFTLKVAAGGKGGSTSCLKDEEMQLGLSFVYLLSEIK